MVDGSSLVNFGDISKPVSVLIEKISEAIGGCFKPYQIRRIAHAEVDAEIIKAMGQVEVEKIQKRALDRLVKEEVVRQTNMEEIVEKALPHINENAKSEEIDNDWLVNFFEKCRNASDGDMQAVWAKILSGEANSPGSFSKRSVNFVSSLDKKEAEDFTSLCAFTWNFGIPVPLVIDYNDNIYRDAGLTFSMLSNLEAIGLIKFNALASFQFNRSSKTLGGSYFGKSILLEFQNQSDNIFNLGQVIFSNIGTELSHVAGPNKNKNFFEYCINKWQSRGVKITFL